MNLSTEEAVKVLKAEIIAQDWRISPKRAETIDKSLACLQQHFKERKATHAMLAMAVSVLEYIKAKGGNPPATIDFLKEAMAHVVSQYEDLQYDHTREEQIFKTLFKHFTLLKEKIQAAALPAAEQPTTNQPPPPSSAPSHEETIPTSTNEAPQAVSQAPATPEVDNSDVDKLINDLRDSLDKAGSVGSTIGDLLSQLIAGQNKKNEAARKHLQDRFTEIAKEQQNNRHNQNDHNIKEEQATVDPSSEVIKNCPPTELRLINLGEVKLAVLENIIAAVKPVKRSKLSSYLHSSSVPLKDFGTLFKGLPSQFQGPLGQLKHSKLKKISIPIMVPQGLDLPETADENSTDMLIISNGNWHGAIPCSQPQPQSQNMVRFKKNKNGDIAGTGYMSDDSEVTLLDSLSILRREGFLITPS